MLTRNSLQCCLAAVVFSAANPLLAADPAAPDPAAVARGRELFGRVWQPHDERSPGGDGLGPVFNDTSCAACHNQGGLGGAGSSGHNVRILTIAAATAPHKKGLLHPGFKTQSSVVLHHAGVERRYEAWHDRLVGRAERATAEADVETQQVPPQLRIAMKNYQQGLEHGAKALTAITGAPDPFGVEGPGAGGRRGNWGPNFARLLADTQPAGTLSVSQRNSIALFGAGLIDRIPESAIEAAAAQELAQTPRTAGRVAKLPNQRIGRFGWQAQQASLADFALTAAAVELGLSVPGHPQAGNPLNPKYESPGLDMTLDECVALVAYLTALPRPQEPRAVNPLLAAGRGLFQRIGCADCHRPNLGDVSGLYSDLLLHDLGSDLQASGYGAFVPDAVAAQPADQSWHSDSQWRTPPLWGVASSTPYMHDGRAATLREAILLHGGQAEASADQFRQLAPAEQQDLLDFLGSLVAPVDAEPVAAEPVHRAPSRSPKPARLATKRARQIDDNP